MQKLLIITGWFYPGFKSGGSASTCYNLVMLLKSEYLIYIMTSDRDFGEQEPYKNLVTNQWIDFSENIQILYASPSNLSWTDIFREIKKISPHSIYLNSMYSLYFSIYPLMMKRIGLINMPIVLSPAGMLRESALQLKAAKKKYYLRVLNFIKIQQVVCFQATDEQERMDILKIFGETAVISKVPYAPPLPSNHIISPVKTRGVLKLVFTGRIHPIKNLYFLIECLMQIIHKVELTIVGPVEDRNYYDQCRSLETQLPANIKLFFTGGVFHDQIQYYLRESHFLALPTLGENFGYSIVESFCSARPVIITDRTPWRNLAEQKAGWDVPVNDRDKFIEAINDAAEMDQDEYNIWSQAALNFARVSLNGSDYKNQYVKLFSNST